MPKNKEVKDDKGFRDQDIIRMSGELKNLAKQRMQELFIVPTFVCKSVGVSPSDFITWMNSSGSPVDGLTISQRNVLNVLEAIGIYVVVDVKIDKNFIPPIDIKKVSMHELQERWDSTIHVDAPEKYILRKNVLLKR